MRINNYIYRESVIHRLAPGLKYSLFLLVVLTVPFLPLRIHLLEVLLISCGVLLARLPFIYFQKNLRFVIYAGLFMYVLLLIFPIVNKTFAFVLAFRLYIMFSAMFLLTNTTREIELAKLIARISRKIFNPDTAKSITMIILLVLNFIPLIIKEIKLINLSLKSRGLYLNRGTTKERFRVIIILVESLVRRLDVLIDEIDLVMYGRNLDIENVNNVNFKAQFARRDYLTIGIITILVTLVYIGGL